MGLFRQLLAERGGTLGVKMKGISKAIVAYPVRRVDVSNATSCGLLRECIFVSYPFWRRVKHLAASCEVLVRTWTLSVPCATVGNPPLSPTF